MSEDIHALNHVANVFLWLAAISATLFPIIYVFSPWYKTDLGRVVMLQAFAFAVALDVTLVFSYWKPGDVLFVHWVEVIVFGMIALATSSMTYLLWKLNYEVRRKEPPHNRRSTDGTGLSAK